MKTALRYIAAIAITLATSAHAQQTKSVVKNISGNTITENLVIGSGKTLTIASGATINAAAGSTITGFGSGSGSTAWADITGKPTTLAGYGIADGITAATAASTYATITNLALKAPLASPTFTGTVTIPSGASISGYATTAAVAAGYQPLNAALTAWNDTATTAFGRGLLAAADAAEFNLFLGLGLVDAVEFESVTASTFTGNGSALTALDAGSITTGTVAIANGGTSATTAANARIALLPSMVGNGGKYLRVNAGATDYELATIGGGGDALTSGTLDQFADVTQTATKTLAITESTTLAGGTHSGTNTGDQTTITGNAGTATALQTARTINGTSFDGTANITVTAAAGTLTGTTLNATVTASSLTSLGTIATGVWQGTAVADSYIASAATWNAKQAGDADLTTYAGITPSANVQSLLGAADYSAMRTLLGLVIGTNVQAYDADLTTYAGITPAANTQSLLGAADYSAMRTLLGLVIGTNVQAYDADLTTYAGITPAANTQSLLGAADYSAMRTLLGLVIGTNVQAYDADLTTYAGITPAANTQSLLGAADYSAMRTLLGLVIGTNVQAYDADLADLADGSLTGTLVAAGSTSARGTVELATDGETSASVVVQGNDNRLADAERVEIGLAISDETTEIGTGTAKLTFRMPHAMTVTAVRMSLTTVSSSGTPTVDINEAGTTILSTKLSCDASEKTSTTAATAAVISDTALADDAEITIDIDAAGTGATGAKVWIIGTR